MSELPAMDRSIPKNGKLPWCPICGSPPEGDSDTFARCAMPGCPLNQAYVDAKEWRSLVYKVVKDLKDPRIYTSYPGMANKKELSVFLLGEGELPVGDARDKLGLLPPFYLDAPVYGEPAFLKVFKASPPQRKGWFLEQREAVVLVNEKGFQRGRIPLGLAAPKEAPALPPRKRIDEWIGRLEALKQSYETEDAEGVKDAWQQRLDGSGYDDWDIQLLRVMEGEDG